MEHWKFPILKMRKLLIYLVIFVLSVSLALAVSVTTDRIDYNGDEIVKITIGDCAGNFIVKIIDSGDNLADIKSGSGVTTVSYNALSSSADGKYKITASCETGKTDTYICVDSPGCIPKVEQPQQPSGGGGGYCSPKWSCTSWSFCNNSLRQGRTCTDINNCQKAKEESQACTKCEESWVCSQWSSCSAGTNYRTCTDEHNCGTYLSKPAEQKSCEMPAVQEEYKYVPPTPIFEEEYVPPTMPAIEQPSFWGKYKFYLAAGVAGLALVLLIVLLAVHFLKPKMAYNINELKDWIKREKEAGTSEEDIKEILGQKTGWKEKEIDEAFRRL
ncbi:MAG: hypothetical protein AB1668_02610 [Nanoarchaeota archaeon]